MVDQGGKGKEEHGSQQPAAEQDQLALFNTGFAVDAFPGCVASLCGASARASVSAGSTGNGGR